MSVHITALTIPNALKPGDTIAVISPAAPSAADDMAKGVSYLESLGLNVRVMPHALDSRYYLAGDDTGRLADLHAAFADTTVQGILAARGGYGCIRLLPHLDWDLIRQHPKVFIGFSDLTTLLLPIYQQTGLLTFHGPMLTSNLIDNDAYTQAELWNQVMGKVSYPYAVPNTSSYTCLSPGTAEGPFIGGNLSLLAALCGTPWQPETNGHVLFIEDWHEAYYSIDRQFQQLKLAGIFDSIRGLVLGDFIGTPDEFENYSLATLFKELTAALQVPVGLGFSAGHGDQTATLPMGCPVRFEAASGRLEILSAPVARA